jgi:hypothetical protein
MITINDWPEFCAAVVFHFDEKHPPTNKEFKNMLCAEFGPAEDFEHGEGKVIFAAVNDEQPLCAQALQDFGFQKWKSWHNSYMGNLVTMYYLKYGDFKFILPKKTK